jgi:hypothetical protein
MTPFRSVPDDFRPLRLEILYFRALKRAAKQLSGFGFPVCLRPVMMLDREIASLISRSAITLAIHHKLLIFDVSCLKSERGEAPRSLLAGSNRQNSGFGEVAGGAGLKPIVKIFYPIGRRIRPPVGRPLSFAGRLIYAVACPAFAPWR